ncbi:MAG TPA: class I SAM-dependent methyltransferase, partial [Solirubrobacteraceae bacterium]|nr:class I SAM-dependent methyltransferase [Solirubrobacteraceae bacterium]
MAASGKPPETALWHDLECGGYEADLPLWRELADASDGELLELGCGTGRVALDLAGRGHGVWALDSERVLLAALRERVGDRLALQTVCADARSFTLEQRFGLCAIPMQTIQLLGGATGRRSCLARVRSHLRPAGLLAAAVVDLSGPWARDPEALPAADVCERGG